jgi:DNA repair protein RadC
MDNHTQPPLFSVSVREAAHVYIGDPPRSESPQERMKTLGPGALSAAELLSLLGLPLTDSQHLLSRAGGLVNVARSPAGDLVKTPGVGPALAARIQAALELGKRALSAAEDDAPRITSPRDGFALFQDMSLLEQEELRVASLSTKNRVLRVVTLYRGNVNTTMVRIAEVLRVALQDNAPALLIAHNHPSGAADPSPEDVILTRQLVQAAELMDLALVDHLVVGRGRFVSLRERGMLR